MTHLLRRRSKDRDLEELCAELDPTRIPHHVAIMMDGNRRWAKARNLPPIAGHWKGAETISSLVTDAAEIGVRVLTVYSFSTENWNRGQEEIEGLMHLLKIYLEKEKPRMIREGVRLDTIGDTSRFPEDVRECIEGAKRDTAAGKKIDLVLALNYGARDEIKRATQAIVADVISGKLEKESITETDISRHLDTAKWKDPELVIRTSGETRLSNFLLWQLSYAEIYITATLWPDFSKQDFVEAIIDYQNRQRRLGG